MKKVLSVLLLLILSVFVSGCNEEEIKTGLDSLNAEQYDTAIKVFKSCVDKEGETGENAAHCSFLLGYTYYEKGDYKNSITYINRAFNIYKEGMHAYSLGDAWYYWLGMAYRDNHQYKEAITSFSKALENADEDPIREFDREFAKYSNMDWVKFVRKYYIPLRPPKYACYFRLGSSYYSDGQYEQAVNMLQEAIKLNPKAPHFYAMMAAAYREMKKYNEAIAAVNKAIEIDPNDDFPYSILASIYARQGKFEQAVVAGKRALEINPKDISHYFNLSTIYSIFGDYQNDIAILKRAQEVFPNNFKISYRLGHKYSEMGKYNDAIASLNSAVDINTITGIGTSISIEENYPVVKGVIESGPAKRVGIEVGDKIVKINGHLTKDWDINKVIQNIRGAEGTQVTLTIERKGKEFEKNIARKKIIQKSAAYPLGLRSQVYAAMGNLDQSFKDAEMAYSLDPNDYEAKRAMSLAYTQKGKPDEAVKILSSSKENFDKLLIALAYAKKGDFERSAEVYRDIPEDYLISKSVFRHDFKKMVLQSMKPYIEGKRKQAETLEAKGQHKVALKEYRDLVRFLDEKETKELRAHIAGLLKEKPYLLELPEEARRFAIRAEEYTKEGKFEEAVNEYKKALTIAPFHPELYKALALNYGGMKQYSEAIENMKIYLELYPHAPDARVAKDEIYRWEVQMEKEGR